MEERVEGEAEGNVRNGDENVDGAMEGKVRHGRKRGVWNIKVWRRE